MKSSVSPTFQPAQFDWCVAHVTRMGDTSLTRLGLSKRAPPTTFTVAFETGPITFTHQYNMADDAEEHASRYMAVYWGTDSAVQIHLC
jgi:hypothetical protein